MLLFLVISGIALVFATHLIQAQGDDQPKYVGSRTCAGCHREVSQSHVLSRHALALQDTSKEKGAILGNFEQGEDVRTVQFPGEDQPRAFTADDIVYAVGSGRYMQLYVVKTGGEDAESLMVLPIGWNVAEQAWKPYNLAETWPDPAYDWTTNCAGCHVTPMDSSAGKAEPGVQCEACHGPGGNHIKTVGSVGREPDAEGFAQIRASIVLSPDPQVCGQCHSRGQNPDGVHYPVSYRPGHELLADDVYRLVPTDDPAFWWPTGHGRRQYMQFNEWLMAGHSHSLEALRSSDAARDECLVCHSTDYRWTVAWAQSVVSGERGGAAPEPVTLENAQYGITCVSCHTVHLPVDESGELATGTDPSLLLAKDPYAVCVTCHHDSDITEGMHHPVQEMYEGQTVVNEVQGVPSAHFAADGGPECVTCHTPRVPIQEMDGVTRASHVFRPVLPGAAQGVEGLPDSCSSCHGDQVRQAGLQQLIDDIQASTRARLDAARGALKDDSPDWVRTALDFVEGDGSLGVHNYVYSDSLLDAVEVQLGLVIPPTVPAPATEAAAESAPATEAAAAPATESAPAQ